MESPQTILFLCPHNAAKSIIAAAYCQHLASRRGLSLRAASAGTEPEPEVAPPVVAALRAEGIDVSGHRPRRVTDEELATARRIISLGCDVDDLAPPGAWVERWDDVPSPSRDVGAACAAIRARVERLLDELGGPHGTRQALPGEARAALRRRTAP